MPTFDEYVAQYEEQELENLIRLRDSRAVSGTHKLDALNHVIRIKQDEKNQAYNREVLERAKEANMTTSRSVKVSWVAAIAAVVSAVAACVAIFMGKA